MTTTARDALVRSVRAWFDKGSPKEGTHLLTIFDRLVEAEREMQQPTKVCGYRPPYSTWSCAREPGHAGPHGRVK